MLAGVEAPVLAGSFPQRTLRATRKKYKKRHPVENGGLYGVSGFIYWIEQGSVAEQELGNRVRGTVGRPRSSSDGRPGGSPRVLGHSALKLLNPGLFGGEGF